MSRANPRIQVRARSRSPARSSTPIAGRVTANSSSVRLLTNAVPSSVSSSPGVLPAANPLTRPAITTTSTGLRRSAKPATTTATPSSGQ